MNVELVLLAISLILFFGFFAGFIFKRFGLPDVLFLIILGFALGPFGLNYITGDKVASLAPVFTTFTLLFLLFDGAFNINLSSLIREFSQSFVLTLLNFVVSTIVVAGVMYSVGFTMLPALFVGFMLGGVSSSFVIPILSQLNIKPRLYSLLALESALTDVFCIVFALTVLVVMEVGVFSVKAVVTQIASLFAVAGLIGLLSGVLWIFLIIHVFKQHNYIMAIAYLILVYVVTEFLNGNGAIAALFFGLMLKNSKQLTSIMKGMLTKKAKDKKKALKGDLGVSVTTPSEEYFYHQISFFLKTFFFVYIGVLIDISDSKALIVGGILSLLLMGARMVSLWLTKNEEIKNRALVNTMFARGLAAAAVAQLALQAGIPGAEFIVKVAYVTITGTILLSSLRVFFMKKGFTFIGKTKPWKT